MEAMVPKPTLVHDYDVNILSCVKSKAINGHFLLSKTINKAERQ